MQSYIPNLIQFALFRKLLGHYVSLEPGRLFATNEMRPLFS